MVLSHDDVHPQIAIPKMADRIVAARNSSLVCFMCAFWLFVSPWAFFGVAEQPGAWNAWIVGGAMTLISMLRLTRPIGTTVFGYLNALLALWSLGSPWIIGYTANGARVANTLIMGSCVLGFSLMACYFSREGEQPGSLSADSSD